VASKLTFAGINSAPTWSADGRYLFYTSIQATDPNALAQVYRISAGGTGTPEPLPTHPRGAVMLAVSNRDDWVVMATAPNRAGGGDLVGIRPGIDSTWSPLVESPAFESMPALSPDGRWLAYVSDETGRVEVYVRPFPDVNRFKWQVSVDGGIFPHWSHAGTELYYSNIAGGFMVAEVQTSPAFSVVGRRFLHATGTFPQVDLAPDDQRTLRLWSGGGSDSTSSQLILVQNFLATLRNLK
jgi:Tol biopolymer transport system component